jgi:hypothetical protein
MGFHGFVSHLARGRGQLYSVAVGFTIRTHFPVLECDFLYLFTKYSIEIRLRCLFKFRKSIG